MKEFHTNNINALDVCASELSKRYLNYVNNIVNVLDWYSQYAPEWNDGMEQEYLGLCKRAYFIGF